ncbi:MAG: beta-glucuronidase [Rikenellaceae bacterium]|nr:beta-glucuronidase [Rikenellaceae bacterium]
MKKALLFLAALMSCASLLASTPRAEYPRPQFERSEWINLNGEWQFQIDSKFTGKQDKLYESNTRLSGKIIVPFAPESKLSGVGNTNHMDAVWYKRVINIPRNWDGKKIMLNFGAVDFLCEVWIDGVYVNSHEGGTSSFGFDITPFVKAGKNAEITIYAEDKLSNWSKQPSGKQCSRESYGCFYTRTTGIWQTVWMEAVAHNGLRRARITPDVDNSQFVVEPEFYGLESGQILVVELLDGKKKVATKTVTASNSSIVVLPVKKAKLWSPESPFLYNVVLRTVSADGKTIDEVKSYTGMRKIHWEGRKLFLNNKPFYLRTVLDQGFYPDGVWTAPSDEALKNDILLSKACGFNGARLHQKVFEERFHYWADVLGYVTFGEASDWGSNRVDPVATRTLLKEMADNINRDYNHPSIIGWTPLNEAWGLKPQETFWRFNDELTAMINTIDPTRLCNSVSGGAIHSTDIWTVHTYTQDPARLKKQLEFDENGYPKYLGQGPFKEVKYSGQPYFVDEFGGIKWNPSQQQDNVETQSWGYGAPPKSLEEFYARLKGQVEAIVSNPNICGFCYTQLTDVEQEQNGIYFYDRSEKFDMARIKAIFEMPTAEEQANAPKAKGKR